LFVVIYASAEDITTVNGKTYSNVTVTRVEPDGISIKHSAGIIKLFVNELTPELQEKYKLSSDSAGQYQRNRTLALQQREIEMRRNLEARNAEWGRQEAIRAKEESLKTQVTKIANDATTVDVEIFDIQGDGFRAAKFKIVNSKVLEAAREKGVGGIGSKIARDSEYQKNILGGYWREEDANNVRIYGETIFIKGSTGGKVTGQDIRLRISRVGNQIIASDSYKSYVIVK
jgi:hypothetical protein